MEPIEYKMSRVWLAISTILWFISGIFASFTVVVPLIAAFFIIRSITQFLSTTLTIDSGGVSLKQGLLMLSEKRFPLANINSVSTNVGPLGSQFDYGTIIFSVGNDRNEIKIRNLAGCQDLKSRLDKFSIK